jgi:hypothetical protein
MSVEFQLSSNSSFANSLRYHGLHVRRVSTSHLYRAQTQSNLSYVDGVCVAAKLRLHGRKVRGIYQFIDTLEIANYPDLVSAPKFLRHS